MDRRTFVKTLPALAVVASASSGFAEESRPITLPRPEKEGGKSVLAALESPLTMRAPGGREVGVGDLLPSTRLPSPSATKSGTSSSFALA